MQLNLFFHELSTSEPDRVRSNLTVYLWVIHEYIIDVESQTPTPSVKVFPKCEMISLYKFYKYFLHILNSNVLLPKYKFGHLKISPDDRRLR